MLLPRVRLALASWHIILGAASLASLCGCEGRLLTLGRLADEGGTSGIDSSGGRTSQSGGGGGVAGVAQGGIGGNSSTFLEPLFESIELVSEIAASSEEYVDENPTLTGDMLEIYFNSDREGSQDSDDVWMARRDSVDSAFDLPVVVTEVNTTASESSPAISADGLTLWVGAELDGGLGGRDIWRFERTDNASEFTGPFLETALSSEANDIPRPLGNGELTMPLASEKAGGMYLTYWGERKSTTSDFASPSLVTELNVDDYRTTDAFLTNDGLTIYFARASSDTDGDLYAAHRTSQSQPFGEVTALSTVNTDGDERDPWLSADGSVLYFVSDRDGISRIYRAQRVLP